MFYSLSLILYLLFFAFITWRRFNLGLALLFLLLPTYLIHFHIGPLPTTLLEVMLWIIFIVWLIKYNQTIVCGLWSIVKRHHTLFIAILLFLTAATVSIFTSSDLRAAAGEWKAFYVEPLVIFIILVTNYQLLVTKNFINKIIFALVLGGLATSLLAIYQHFTGWLVPYDFWQNQNTFRVTAWYGFPNAVGLFLAPLIPLAIHLIYTSFKKIKQIDHRSLITNHFSSIIYYLSFIISILFLPAALLAIIFSKGAGPLIGALAGIGFLLLINKKTRLITCLVGLVSIVSIVSLPSFSRIKQELLLQDRPGQIRLSIWNETWQFLKDNPVSGAGLASYTDKIKPYHTQVNGEGIEIFHHPHNIFLTMWVNLGLLGLASFIWLLYSLFLIPYSLFKSRKNIPILNYFVISSLIIIIVMGLVDSPYIKNDLSILFWLLPALLIISQYELEK